MIESPIYPVVLEKEHVYFLRFLTAENKLEKNRIEIIEDVLTEKGFVLSVRFIEFNIG